MNVKLSKLSACLLANHLEASVLSKLANCCLSPLGRNIHQGEVDEMIVGLCPGHRTAQGCGCLIQHRGRERGEGNLGFV